jgi:hypothetical protein
VYSTRSFPTISLPYLLLENVLKRVTRYVILRIQKRESQKDTAYPRILSFNLLQGQPSTIRGSWRLFSLCHSKNKPPAMQGEGRSLDISMNSCAKINVGLQTTNKKHRRS